jgi:hypothetical protein
MTPMSIEPTKLAVLITCVALLAGARSAVATGAYAVQTGKPCGQCHQNPGVDMKLTAYGQAFVANGNKAPPEPPPVPQTPKPPAGGSTPPR